MRVKINKGDDYFGVYINDKLVPCDAIVVEMEEAGAGIVHLFASDLKVDTIVEDTAVSISHKSPDPRPYIAELVRGLPAGVVEAAALDELGMSDNSIVGNAIGVIADLIMNMDLEGAIANGEDQHECSDDGDGQPDDRQDLDLLAGGGGLLQ